jgi:hypothetical protein
MVYSANHKTIIYRMSMGRMLRSVNFTAAGMPIGWPLSAAATPPGTRARCYPRPSRVPGGSAAVTYADEMPPSTMNSVALM